MLYISISGNTKKPDIIFFLIISNRTLSILNRCSYPSSIKHKSKLACSLLTLKKAILTIPHDENGHFKDIKTAGHPAVRLHISDTN